MVTKAAIDTPGNPQLSIDAPTITRYMELAAEFIQAVDALVAKLPRFENKHPSNAAFISAHMGISLKCLNTAVAAVEETPELQGLNRLKVAEARDTLQFIDAFTPVVDKIQAFAEGLQFTIKARRAELAVAVLQIYGAAKLLARNPDMAAVGVHAANIGRDLARKGRRPAAGKESKSKGKAKTEPATPPSGSAPAPVVPVAPISK
jgi:hypothetical protein